MIPVSLVRQILNELVAGNILSETRHDESGELVYQLARDIHQLNIKTILNAINDTGVANLPVSQTEDFKRIDEIIQDINNMVENSNFNKRLSEI